MELKALQEQLNILRQERDQAKAAETIAQKALAAHEAHMKEGQATLSQQSALVEQLTAEKHDTLRALFDVYNVLLGQVISTSGQKIQGDKIAGMGVARLIAGINDVVRGLPRLVQEEPMDILNLRFHYEINQIKIRSQVQIIGAYEKLTLDLNDLIMQSNLSEQQKKIAEQKMQQCEKIKNEVHQRAREAEKAVDSKYEAPRKALRDRLNALRQAR